MNSEISNIKQVNFIEHRKPNIDNLSALENHLSAHAPLFLSRLALFTFNPENPYFGPEIIQQGESGLISKSEVSADSIDNPQQPLFTSRMLCTLSSLLVKLAIEELAPNKFRSSIIEIKTDFTAENWGNPHHNPHFLPHDIVKVTEEATDLSRYVDASYAQVDHRVIGHILISPPEQLETYYLRDPQKTFHDVSERRDLSEFFYIQILNEQRQNALLAALIGK